MKWIRPTNSVARVYWICATRTRLGQAWAAPGLVTHYSPDPFGRTLEPCCGATLVRPVVPNPSLAADDEIVGSAFQLVLIPDLFADGGPIVFVEVFQFVEKRITLLDAREWEIPWWTNDQQRHGNWHQWEVLPWYSRHPFSIYKHQKKIYQIYRICRIFRIIHIHEDWVSQQPLISASFLGMYLGKFTAARLKCHYESWNSFKIDR